MSHTDSTRNESYKQYTGWVLQTVHGMSCTDSTRDESYRLYTGWVVQTVQGMSCTDSTRDESYRSSAMKNEKPVDRFHYDWEQVKREHESSNYVSVKGSRSWGKWSWYAYWKRAWGHKNGISVFNHFNVHMSNCLYMENRVFFWSCILVSHRYEPPGLHNTRQISSFRASLTAGLQQKSKKYEVTKH